MTLAQILATLRARWKIALSVFAFVILAAAAYNLLAPRKYTATTAVMVDVKSPDPMSGNVLPALTTPSYMATQVDLLASERVALQVVRQMRLNENASLKEQWQSSTKGIGDFDTWVANLLSRELDIKPSRESNILQISYAGADPQYAAAMANAFANAYLITSAELKMEPARQYNALFEELNNQLRVRLEKAQARLSAFQREKGLIGTDERLDVETARLNDLSTQVTQLQALLSESSNRKAQVMARPEQAADVIGNPLIASLKADVSRAEAKMEETQQRLGDNHPTIIEMKASVAALRQRITNEYARVAQSVGGSNTVNVQRLAELRKSLDDQRTKVLQMKALRDEASVMLRDVDNIQRAYDVVQSRATQARMESQTALTNLSIVKTATPPNEYSSPRVLITMVLATFAGALLALLSALGVELLDRRVRTVDDVARVLRLPTIGVMLKGPEAASTLMGARVQPWLMRRDAVQAIAHNSDPL